MDQLLIKISAFAEDVDLVDGVLSLPFEKRQKSRLRAQLESGDEVGLMLPRGTVLRGGDYLLADDGQVIQVKAEAEKTSKVISSDPLLLLRAAYHLGNRHVPLQVANECLRYLQDHVLDEMVRQLGLEVKNELAPFEPEKGAYESHGHNH